MRLQEGALSIAAKGKARAFAFAFAALAVLTAGPALAAEVVALGA